MHGNTTAHETLPMFAVLEHCEAFHNNQGKAMSRDEYDKANKKRAGEHIPFASIVMQTIQQWAA